jgi:16S rRNA (cytosine1402-N4)-methyltransferase
LQGWHIPVLREEVLRWLRVVPEGVYVDATVGTGGHAVEIARRLTTGRLVGLDRDAEALAVARERLAPFGERVILVQERFSRIDEVARQLRLPPLAGLLADLGVSSLQLERAERGFSFLRRGPLDMRMDRQQTLSADDLINRTGVEELAELLRRYGEEREARRIARAIVRARPIRDTEHLATVVAGARKAKGRQKLHPATKTFLALRIAVNRELEELEQFLDRAPATLAPGGRWVILSYHSLEDRRVKQAFRNWAAAGVLRVLTRKPVRPTPEEVESNPRARSARLRAAEKLEAEAKGAVA